MVNPTANATASGPAQAVPFEVILGFAGTFLGTSKQTTFTTGAGDSTPSLGDQTDTWDAGLTAAIVNDPTFGAVGSGLPGTVNTNWSVDSFEITVFYSAIDGTVVSVTASSGGSFTPTVLGGYQLYAAIYDPVTQHMGNREPIGGANTISDTLSALIISSLPELEPINPEWVWAIGMTQDGGQNSLLDGRRAGQQHHHQRWNDNRDHLPGPHQRLARIAHQQQRATTDG